jgi:hypothetical protein
MRVDALPDLSSSWEGLRAALVIAHPGHELRIHHWLERVKPRVFVLTDGSGRSNRSRLGQTTALLDAVGALRGSIFGHFTDRELYRAILALDADAFVVLAQELAAALDHAGIDYVVGDAVEGFSPGHDMCRLIINAAVMQLEAKTGRRLANFEFAVEGAPDACPPEEREHAIVVRLDEDAYRRKLAAAHAYAEIAVDMARLASSYDMDAFRVECLAPVRYDLEIEDRFEHPAIYEAYGEKQVAAGFYSEAIRFRRHLAPVAAHLAAEVRHIAAARAASIRNRQPRQPPQ